MTSRQCDTVIELVCPIMSLQAVAHLAWPANCTFLATLAFSSSRRPTSFSSSSSSIALQHPLRKYFIVSITVVVAAAVLRIKRLLKYVGLFHSRALGYAPALRNLLCSRASSRIASGFPSLTFYILHPTPLSSLLDSPTSPI